MGPHSLNHCIVTCNFLPIHSLTPIPQAILTPNHRAVVTAILCDVEDVAQALAAHISDPPRLPHTPPTASKLVWLHGLGERVGGAMSTLKSAAPELLEGELGWRLRQAYADLVSKLQR